MTNLLGSAFTTLVGRTDLHVEASVRVVTLSQERKMQVQGPPWVTLLRPPSGSLHSFFNSSVRVLNSLRSVQWETSKVQKSSRKMTCRRMNAELSISFRLSGMSTLPVYHKQLPFSLTNWRAAIENTELHNFSTMVFPLYCDKRDSKITLMLARNCPTSTKT